MPFYPDTERYRWVGLGRDGTDQVSDRPGRSMHWLTSDGTSSRVRNTASDRCLAVQLAAAFLMQPAQGDWGWCSTYRLRVSLVGAFKLPAGGAVTLPRIRAPTSVTDAATRCGCGPRGGGDGEPIAPGGSPPRRERESERVSEGTTWEPQWREVWPAARWPVLPGSRAR